MSRHPGQTDGTYRRHLDPDELAVECWCRTTTVGLTRSCGTDACNTHDIAHRAQPKETT